MNLMKSANKSVKIAMTMSNGSIISLHHLFGTHAMIIAELAILIMICKTAQVGANA